MTLKDTNNKQDGWHIAVRRHGTAGWGYKQILFPLGRSSRQSSWYKVGWWFMVLGRCWWHVFSFKSSQVTYLRREVSNLRMTLFVRLCTLIGFNLEHFQAYSLLWAHLRLKMSQIYFKMLSSRAINSILDWFSSIFFFLYKHIEGKRGWGGKRGKLS